MIYDIEICTSDVYIFIIYGLMLLQDKEFIDDSPKSRSEFSKDKNDDINDKEINNKYLLPRLQKQFENSDATNKLQNVSSTSMQILIINKILSFLMHYIIL